MSSFRTLLVPPDGKTLDTAAITKAIVAANAARSLNQAIFKHDIPAIYLRYIEGLRVRDFSLIWDANLPDYFSNALEAENSKNLDLEDFKPLARPGSTTAPVWVH